MPAETDERISVAGVGARLRNLVTGEILTSQSGFGGGRFGGRGGGGGGEPRTTINAHLLPHSYAVYAVER